MFRTMPRKLAMARAHVVSEMEHVHARAYHVLRDLASACSRIFVCTRRPILGNVEEFHSDRVIDGWVPTWYRERASIVRREWKQRLIIVFV